MNRKNRKIGKSNTLPAIHATNYKSPFSSLTPPTRTGKHTTGIKTIVCTCALGYRPPSGHSRGPNRSEER